MELYMVKLVHEGRVGKAYEFDGDGDYIKTPNLWDVGTGDISISVWFKTDGAITDWAYLVSNKDDFNNNFIRVGFDTSGHLRFYTEEDAGANAVFVTDNEYDDSNWHHVVFIRSGSVGKIYVDGGAEIKLGTTKAGDLGTDDYWFIGQAGNDGDYFNGTIDEVMIFNRSLSESEIKELYNLTKGKYAYTDNDLGCAPNETYDQTMII